jgi:hypothetical protein
MNAASTNLVLASGSPQPLKRRHRRAARDHHRRLAGRPPTGKNPDGAVGQREGEVFGKRWHRGQAAGQRNPGRLAHPLGGSRIVRCPKAETIGCLRPQAAKKPALARRLGRETSNN